MKIGKGVAIGMIFLIAAGAHHALSATGPGEPATKIEIYVNENGMNIIEFINFIPGDRFLIEFERTIGSENLDKILEGTISETTGYGYHVGIGCTEIENGECFDLTPGSYRVFASGWLNNEEPPYTAEGKIEVLKQDRQ